MENNIWIVIITVVSFGAITVIFLLLREFFCWYWKINKRNKLLKEIQDILRHNIPEEIAKEIEKKYSDKEDTDDKKTFFSDKEKEENYWPE